MVDEVREHELLAVIDVGSRALRLGIGERSESGKIRHLETLSSPVSIGLDTFFRGSIRASTTESVLKALKNFALTLRDYGLEPKDCYAVATSAIRDAKNKEVFLDRILQRTGFDIQIIESIEEARLADQLAKELIGDDLYLPKTMLLALGGGGTQLVIREDDEVLFAQSFPFGMLKLRGKGEFNRAWRAAKRELKLAVSSAVEQRAFTDIDRLVVISSDILRLASDLKLGDETEWGISLEDDDIAMLLDLRNVLTVGELKEKTTLTNASIELAFLAIEEVQSFLRDSLSELFLPNCSMLDSVMLDHGLKGAYEGRAPSSLIHTVESSAWAHARKFHPYSSLLHVAKVRQLALELFDHFRSFSGLSSIARLRLSIAAILHDIGRLIGTEKMEKHSAYLIRECEMMGLSAHDRNLVAHCVDNIYCSLPSVEALALDSLAIADRVEVLKLTAILRIAVALNRFHLYNVARLDVETTHDEVRIIAHTHVGDREISADIQDLFKERSDLATDVFGMGMKLVEVLAS